MDRDREEYVTDRRDPDRVLRFDPLLEQVRGDPDRPRSARSAGVSLTVYSDEIEPASSSEPIVKGFRIIAPTAAANSRTAAWSLVIKVCGVWNPTATAVASWQGLYSLSLIADGWFTHRAGRLDSTPPSPTRAWACAKRRSGSDNPAGSSKSRGWR
jgi:hypothetical protein